MTKTARAANLLLLCYCVVVLWIILFKFAVTPADWQHLSQMHFRSLNFFPFGASVMVNGQLEISELLYNALIFVPFGGLLGITQKKNCWLDNFCLILLFSLSLEICQYILAVGATDITDLLMNVTGGLLGLLIYTALKNIIREQKLDRLLTMLGIFLFSCTSLLLLALLLFSSR